MYLINSCFFCGISCKRECLALQRALLWKLLKIFLLWEEGYDTSFVNNIKHLYVSYLYEVLAKIYTVLKKTACRWLIGKKKINNILFLVHCIRKNTSFLACFIVHGNPLTGYVFEEFFFYSHCRVYMFLPRLYYGLKQIVVFLLQFFQFLQFMHHFDRHPLSIMPPLADLSKSGSFASSN